MTQARLKNGPRTREISFPRRRLRRLRHLKVVLRQRDHEVRVIVHARALDRLAGTEAAGGIRTQRFQPPQVDLDGHGLFLASRIGRVKISEDAPHPTSRFLTARDPAYQLPMTPIRLLLLALLIALAACGQPDESYDGIDFKTCGVRPHAVLPVVFRGNVPVVHATIKGQPATLILDTGATGLVLTESALHRLNLETDQNRLIVSHGVGGETKSFAGKLEDFQIEGMHVPDHPVSVLPNSSVMASKNLVDGLFGGDVLANFEVDLDLPHRQVTLYAGRICTDTKAAAMVRAMQKQIDASGSANLRFVIPVELDGHKLTAMIDTGAAGSIVAADVAQALGVTPEMLQQGPRATLVGTGPGQAYAYVHRFKEIRVGDDTYQGPMLLVADRPDPKVDVIIGSDYLIQHHLWLSYATKRVFIERAPQHNAGS